MVETVPGSRILGNAVDLTGNAVMADLIAKLQAAGESYRIPLFRAAPERRINFAGATDSKPMLMRYLKNPRRPVVALLIGWAEHVFLHATSGQAFHYEMMVMGAEMKQCVLVIASTASTLLGWPC